MSNKRSAPHPLFLALVLAFSALAALLGAATMRSVSDRETAEGVSQEQPVGAPVRVVAVERRVAAMAAHFRGFLEPFLQLTLAAEVPGEIVEQWVDVSSDVEKGGALFRIDDAVLEVEHEQALAAQDKATADYTRAKAHWDRIRGLEQQQVTPTERVDSEAQYLSAKAVQRRAEATVRRAALLMERTAVPSPISGVVSRIHARRGEFIQPGQAMAEVIQVDRLKLLVELEDRDILWVREGDSAVLTTSMFPVERFEGRVYCIHPKALSTSRKFEVEIELPNASGKLRPGFFMNGTIEKRVTPAANGDARGVLVVPREAVVEQQDQTFCWVVRPSAGAAADSETGYTATRTPVVAVPAAFDARMVRLLDGASEGDLVVVKGVQHLSDQTRVRITR